MRRVGERAGGKGGRTWKHQSKRRDNTSVEYDKKIIGPMFGGREGRNLRSSGMKRGGNYAYMPGIVEDKISQVFENKAGRRGPVRKNNLSTQQRKIHGGKRKRCRHLSRRAYSRGGPSM